MHKKSPYDVMLADYLSENYNINNPRKLFRCLNPEHSDEHPSMSITKDGKYCHCFACGKTYTLTELVMQDRNCGYYDAINYLKDKYINIKLDKYNEKMLFQKNETTGYDEITKALEDQKENKRVDQEAVKYLTSRGFKNAEEICYLSALKVINNRLYIPHFHSGKRNDESNEKTICTDYISRSLNKEDKLRYIRQKNVSSTYFGLYDLKDVETLMRLNLIRKYNPVIFISEGEIDALSYYDLIISYAKSRKDHLDFKQMPKKDSAGYDYLNYFYRKNNIFVDSIATSSTGNVDNFLKTLESLDKNVRNKLYFVVSCDNDNAGSDANKKIVDYLEKNHLLYIKNPFVTKDFKDINERLEKDRNNLQKVFDSFAERNNSYINYAYGKREYEKNPYSIVTFNDGRKYIPFVNCFCFEGKLNKNKNIHVYGVDYGEETPKYIEKRVLAKAKSKIDDQITNLKNQMESAYYNSFKLHDENNQIFVKIRTGYYLIPEKESRNALEILGSISRNKVYVNQAAYPVDGYGKFDNYMKKGISIIEGYNSKNELVYKEEWKDGVNLANKDDTSEKGKSKVFNNENQVL